MAPKRQNKVKHLKASNIKTGDLVRFPHPQGHKTNWLLVVEIKEIGNTLEFTCGTKNKRTMILRKNQKILTQKQLPEWQQ